MLVLDVPPQVALPIRNLGSTRHPLAHVKALTELIRMGEAARDEAVRRCRQQPRPERPSWAAIGRAASMNSSSAQERWKRVEGEQAPLFPLLES
jgi:hypothetical protein